MAIWWDGSAWRRVQASANDGYNYSELSNLVCLATRSCLGLDGRTATSNQASPSPQHDRGVERAELGGARSPAIANRSRLRP